MKIFNAEVSRYSQKARDKLSCLGEVLELDADRGMLLENICDVDVVVIALGNTLDREVFECAKQLKVIVTPTTGTNHIDLIAAQEFQVEVLSLKGEYDFLQNVSATAEHTWGLLLCLLRKINLAHQDVIEGSWDRNQFIGNELRGQVLGIVGLGRLGKIVAEYGKAFGMKVIAHDIEIMSEVSDVQSVSMDELLKSSDVVTLHVPLDETTVNYFGKEKFNKLTKSPVFINTSRGELVDEKALIYALENGLIKGAAIDVLADEVSIRDNWLEHSLLWKYAKQNGHLLITPHIAGATVESVEKTNWFMIEKLESYINP